jgi:hypothetical protein
MKNVLLALLRSIAITGIVSLIIGSVAYLTGYSFILFSVITFFTQFFLYYLVGMYIEYKRTIDSRLVTLKEAEILAKNTITVQCASCKKESDVVVSTNIENKFVCGHCKAKNSVYVYAETALVTEPLYEPPAVLTENTNAN